MTKNSQQILVDTKMNEKINIYPDSLTASKYVATLIAAVIRNKQLLGENAIIGLATGATPKEVYSELIRMHKEEGLSFKNVITFNLDEYYPIEPTDKQSYMTFMKQNLFDHVDILSENINIPSGIVTPDQITAHCNAYEDKIKHYGGLDIQLLGIGQTGHIGFNEPGSTLDSTTRLVTLSPLTREDAIDTFNGLENVPTQAITMGINTIIEAKEIILLALSARKSEIITKAIQAEITPEVPATYLQNLPHVEYVLDQGAAILL